MQTNRQPRQAVVLCGGSAVSQIAKFRREVQCDCTAVQLAVMNRVGLEAPVSLGEALKTFENGSFQK